MSFDPAKSIFHVTGKSKNDFGTCFLIYKDKEFSYFVTCDHVVKDVSKNEDLYVDNQPASIVAFDPSNGFDLAILKTSKLFNAIPFDLNYNLDGIKKGTKLKGCGLYEISSSKQKLVEEFDCSVKKRTRILSSTGKQEDAFWISLNEDEDQLHQGFSGAPIFDNNNRVCGFIHQRTEDAKNGLANSINTLFAVWEKCPLTNIPQSVRSRLIKPEDSIVNCEKPLTILEKSISNELKELKVITLKGASGMGKSRVLREYLKILKQNEIPNDFIDLKTNPSVEVFLDKIITFIGIGYFSKYQDFLIEKKPREPTRQTLKDWELNLARKFYMDLSKIPKGKFYYFIIDHFEKADSNFKHWVTLFIEKNSKKSPLSIIVGGQEIPQIAFNGKLKIDLELGPIPIDYYKDYRNRKKIPLNDQDLEKIHMACNGSPKLLLEYFKKILAS